MIPLITCFASQHIAMFFLIFISSFSSFLFFLPSFILPFLLSFFICVFPSLLTNLLSNYCHWFITEAKFDCDFTEVEWNTGLFCSTRLQKLRTYINLEDNYSTALRQGIGNGNGRSNSHGVISWYHSDSSLEIFRTVEYYTKKKD